MPRTRSDNLLLKDISGRAGFFEKTAFILASWFGTGFVPAASGTFGTIAALPMVFLLNHLGMWYGALGLAAFVAIAVWSSHRVAKRLGKEDPSVVVIDEVAGFLVTMFLLPTSLTALGSGFLIFRVFDIIKPFPVNRAEKLPGGWGIVADDLLAGVYAHICVRIILGYLVKAV